MYKENTIPVCHHQNGKSLSNNKNTEFSATVVPETVQDWGTQVSFLRKHIKQTEYSEFLWHIKQNKSKPNKSVTLIYKMAFLKRNFSELHYIVSEDIIKASS